MGNVLNWADVKKQSEQVYGQFGESKWIPYAKENNKLERKNTDNLKNIGIGKYLLLCGMGESLEENIDVIKKYRDRFDIVTCDKGFVPLYDRGIVADYVMVCDCNILFNHIEKHIDKTENTKLLATPYASLEYTRQWRGERYFFINQDSIQTEKKFIDIMGDDVRVIPAGSNVSNGMMIFFTGSDEYQNINWGGYEKYIMVGYDYSWRANGNYYAWSNPKPKRHYMHHRTMLDCNGDIVFTSENLWFSAKWAYSYITTFHLPVVNCSGRGVLMLGDSGKMGNLEDVLSKINPSRRSIEDVYDRFEALKLSNMQYNNAKMLFEKTRGYRYDYRTEC